MPPDASLPTGTQHELRHGDQLATVTEQGATLRGYDVAGRPVVDGFGADARPEGGRGQILAPWPNRIRDGRYSFAGTDHQLPITEVATHNAIHGLVRWIGWDLAGRGNDWARLTTTVWPQPGYPFRLELSATYRLTDDGLVVSVAARNDGHEPAPYGVGQHPYVRVATIVDGTPITVPADSRLVSDDRGTPVGRESVAGTPFDFRSAREPGDLVLDAAYCDLRRDSAGHAVVAIGDGDRVELWADEAARYLQVFSGDTLADAARRRQGLAVEPMSCPPGAFASGTDLTVLEPGDEHQLVWGLRVG